MKIYNLNIPELPTTYGVYFLYSDDELLWIGKANNIQRRIKNHKFPSYINQALVNPEEIKRVSYILCKNSEDALDVESTLLSCISTKYNGSDNKGLCKWWCSVKNRLSPEENYKLLCSVDL